MRPKKIKKIRRKNRESKMEKKSETRITGSVLKYKIKKEEERSVFVFVTIPFLFSSTVLVNFVGKGTFWNV